MIDVVYQISDGVSVCICLSIIIIIFVSHRSLNVPCLVERAAKDVKKDKNILSLDKIRVCPI